MKVNGHQLHWYIAVYVYVYVCVCVCVCVVIATVIIGANSRQMCTGTTTYMVAWRENSMNHSPLVTP